MLPGNSAAPGRVSATLFASIDGMVASLSGAEAVFQERASGLSHVMTVDVLAAMDVCRVFAPIDAHIQRIQQRLPKLQGQGQAVAQVLDYLIKRGLLQSATDLLSSLSTERIAVDAPLGLCIRTCDRPEQLKTLLASVLAYEARFGRGLDYFVMDDSRSVAAQGDNARLVKEAAVEVRAHYLGRPWRQRFASALVARCGHADTVKWLLDPDPNVGFTGGAVWNAISLLAAGKRVLMLDDDFSLAAWQMSPRSTRLSLHETAHLPAHFEPSLDTLEAALSPYEGDPLAPHLDSCGQPVGALLHPSSGLDVTAQAIEGMHWNEAHRLLSSTGVKATALGAWGDSRMDTVMWFYLMPAEYTQGLRQNGAAYRALLARPLLAHGARQPQLARFSNFTPLSIDHRELMPPTAPHGRGEDFLFAAWSRFLHPRSVSVQLPTLFRHVRASDERRESPVPEAFVPWLSRFMGEYALARVEQCEAMTPGRRLSSLAGLYRDLADGSEQRLARVLREFLAFMRAQIVHQTQTALAATPEAPESWFQDARTWIEENGKALTSDAPPALRDFSPTLDQAGCARALATGLERYADGLEVWSDLWSVCRDGHQELLDL